MVWTVLDDIDVTNGSDAITVNQSINLQSVRAGWGLRINETGEFLEIAAGTNHSGGVATLTLSSNYAGTTASGLTASIIPLSASTQALLQQFDASTALIAQYTNQFPALSGAETDMALIVDASGNGFEVVPGSEFLQRTGLSDALNEVFDDVDQAVIDTAKAAAQTAANLSERWASEDEDVVVASGEYSSKHYSEKAENFKTAAQSHATTATTQAGIATTQAGIATSAKTSAESAEAGAIAQVVLAQAWASEDEDTVVSSGLYSAYHYSTKASESADLSEAWAETEEDTEVSTGRYSALHHAAKAESFATAAAASLAALDDEVEDAQAAATLAERWATEDEDTEISGGLYSSLHYAAKSESFSTAALASENLAEKWANEDEDTVVSGGEYSAKHYSIKAAAEVASIAAYASTASGGASTATAQAELAERWATEDEDTEVTTGLYSSLHYAAKSEGFSGSASSSAATATTQADLAQKWATETVDVIVSGGQYSSLHYSTKALASAELAAKWAEEDEDVEVATGEYSAKHHAIKASDSADAAAASYASLAGEVTQAEDAANLAEEWANNPENTVVTGTSNYSARHWAIQAQASATGALIYRGSYNASGDVAPAGPNELGDYYKISVAGDFGGHEFKVGDSAIYNGSGWDKVDNTESVTSVAGRLGDVTLVKGDVGLGNVVNVDTSNASNISSGTLNAARLPASIDADTTGNAATATDADLLDGRQGSYYAPVRNITVPSSSQTEFSYYLLADIIANNGTFKVKGSVGGHDINNSQGGGAVDLTVNVRHVARVSGYVLGSLQDNDIFVTQNVDNSVAVWLKTKSYPLIDISYSGTPGCTAYTNPAALSVAPTDPVVFAASDYATKLGSMNVINELSVNRTHGNDPYSANLIVDSDANDGTGGISVRSYSPTINLLDKTSGLHSYRHLVDSGSWSLQYDANNADTWDTFFRVDSNGDTRIKNGKLILEQEGRIQGIDVVTAGTDAVSKNYVDNNTSHTVAITSNGNASDAGYWTKIATISYSGTNIDHSLMLAFASTSNSSGSQAIVAFHIRLSSIGVADDLQADVISGSGSILGGDSFKVLTDDGISEIWIQKKVAYSRLKIQELMGHSTGGFTITYLSGQGWQAAEPVGDTANVRSAGLTYNGAKVWNEHNDGATSGLDADMLDGEEGSYYLNYNNFTNTPSIPSTESIQDIVGAMFSGNTETGITATYQDGDGTIDLVVSVSKSDVGLGNVANVDTTNASNISSGTLASGRLPATIAANTTGNAATATNATQLNGQSASYYLNYENLTNVPSAGYPSFVLDGGMTAGDPVKLLSNGKIGPVEFNNFGSEVSIPWTLGSASCYSARLSDTRFAVVNRNGSAGLEVVVGTSTGGVITYTSVVEVTNSNHTQFDIAAVSDSRFVVVYGDGTELKAALFTVPSTMILLIDDEYLLTSENAGSPKLCALSATKLVVTYRYAGTGIRYLVFDISGASFSVPGSPGEVEPGIDNVALAITALDSTRVLAVYKNGSSQGRASVGSLTGSTFTFGTGINFDITATCTRAGASYYESVGLIAYELNGGDKKLVSYTVSGTTLTVEVGVTVSSGDVGNVAVALQSGTLGCVVYEGPSGNAYATEVVLSGTDITLQSTLLVSTTNTPNDTVSCVSLSDGQFWLGYRYDSVVMNTISGTANRDVLGILQETGTSSESKPVAISGTVSEAHSGLTINQTYYVDYDGSITTSDLSTAKRLGKAISATKMLIDPSLFI